MENFKKLRENISSPLAYVLIYQLWTFHSKAFIYVYSQFTERTE